MKIGISGCGITGAAAGLMLGRSGHEVHLFEQANVSDSIGAGILVSPRGQEMLSRLGVLEGIRKSAEELVGIQAFVYQSRRDQKSKELIRMDYSWLSKELFGLGVHRGKLFSRLLEDCRASGATVHNGFRTDRTEESSDGVRFLSDTGVSTEPFDCVLIADGSRSKLRQQYDPACQRIAYDYAAVWATAACSYQPQRLVQVVDGTKRLLGMVPIGCGESSFFWGIPTGGFEELRKNGFELWRDEVLEFFPESASIFESLRDFDGLTYAAYHHVRMSRWWFDRVLFLGDAAHPMSPHLGQGVNLAVEDVVCFCDALEKLNDFHAACREYEAQRKSKLRYYQLLTRLLSPYFQSRGTIKGVGRNIFLPWMPKTPFVRREMLRTLCGFKQGWFR